MNVRVQKEHVIEGLQKAASILPTKSGAAYLRSIWLKAEENTLSIMATDTSLEFCGSYTAEVESQGLVGVQGRAFVDLLSKLPAGTISLTLDADNNVLRVEQGRRKYKIPTNDPVWFQNFSDFPAEGAVMWSGDFLQDILERITFCISDEDGAAAIACLFMKPIPAQSDEEPNNRIEACGLNGHQFALMGFMNDELHQKLPADGMLINKKYLGDLKKWLGGDEIELNTTDKRLYLRTGDGSETFSLPLTNSAYPDYMNFMAKLSSPEVSTLKLNRKDCMDALTRLQIFHSDNNRCAYLHLAANEVTMTAKGQETGSASEYLEVVYEGSLTRIAFPTKNLIDIMNHFQSAELTLTMTGAEGPCGIAGDDDPEYTVILMPMKITDETYYSEEEA